MNDDLTISLPGALASPAGPIITIQVQAGKLYSIVEEALRVFTGWFTVTARRVCRGVAGKVRRIMRHVCRMAGIPILRKCSILRI